MGSKQTKFLEAGNLNQKNVESEVQDHGSMFEINNMTPKRLTGLRIFWVEAIVAVESFYDYELF
jgi:hypothetical protein